MVMELHHLNTHGMMEQAGNVLDGVVRLKQRIAELEEERRWRKFPEEKPDSDTKQYLVYDSKTRKYGKSFYSLNLKDFQFPVTHWMPLPSAPKEEK